MHSYLLLYFDFVAPRLYSVRRIFGVFLGTCDWILLQLFARHFELFVHLLYWKCHNYDYELYILLNTRDHVCEICRLAGAELLELSAFLQIKVTTLFFNKYLMRVVRKSPSSGLKNRVIFAYWKLPQLVEMLKNACMFGVKRTRNS